MSPSVPTKTRSTRVGQTLLTWDLEGSRRFIARRPLAEPAEPAVVAVLSPTGEAVAYTGCGRSAAWQPAVPRRRDRSRRPPRRSRHMVRRRTAWRPDGTRYATAGDDGFVRVWDWRTRPADRRTARRRRTRQRTGLHRRRPATCRRRTNGHSVHDRRRDAGARRKPVELDQAIASCRPARTTTPPSCSAWIASGWSTSKTAG